MQYQRLRMQELEMMKDVMGDELEETQGYLDQMEGQIGQIHRDLSDSWAKLGGNSEQWAHLFPRLSQDNVLSRCEAHSARCSEYGNSATSSSFPTHCLSP